MLGLLVGCGEGAEPEIRSLGSSGGLGSTSSGGSVVSTSTSEVAATSSVPITTVPVETVETVETVVSVTPTSTPSAKRLVDGTVISAGGYTARTPSVANGMLLEPAWSVEQQPIVDMIHKYIDAWYLAQAEPHPTGKPSQEMLDLENPRTDLNAQGVDAMHSRLSNLVKLNQKATWADTGVETFFALTNVQTTQNGLVIFLGCELNALAMADQDSGKIVDDKIAEVAWQIAVEIERQPPAVAVANQIAVSKDGNPGCATG